MIDFESFTPVSAALGGLLIACSATLLMLGLGRIAGISGMLRSSLVGPGSDRAWALMFLAGLMAAAALLFHVFGAEFSLRQDYSRVLLVIGGLLVGYGTALGSGCTSGHGVCGLARLSLRSLAATVIFVFFGVFTVYLLRHVMGWST